MRIVDPGTVEGRRAQLVEVAVQSISQPCRGLVVDLIGRVPDEFFTAPASSTGKYHPEFALGDGGLWRHTLACFHACSHLLRLYEFTARYQIDAVYGASLVHDGWKGWDGFRWVSHTVPDHGAWAAKVIREVAAEHEPMASSELMAQMVERHMVQWAEEPYHHTAQTDYIRMLSTADYVVSRRGLVPVFEVGGVDGS